MHLPAYHGLLRKDLTFTPTATILDTNDPFALALNTAIGNLSSMATGGTASQRTFTLNGTFIHVNMAEFADRITSRGCRNEAFDATVRNLIFASYKSAF